VDFKNNEKTAVIPWEIPLGKQGCQSETHPIVLKIQHIEREVCRRGRRPDSFLVSLQETAADYNASRGQMLPENRQAGQDDPEIEVGQDYVKHPL